ncbi:MAG: hypothetical protein ACJAZV_000940 [Roseivirga sp.]
MDIGSTNQPQHMRSIQLKLSPSILFFSFLFLILFNEAIAFQTPKRVMLSEIYRQIIESDEEILQFKGIYLQDDFTTAKNVKDPELFYKALKEKIKIDIPFDSLGIKSNVEVVYMDDITAKTVSFAFLNLEFFEFKVGKFERLNFHSIKADTVFMDSVHVNYAFTIEDSKFNDFSDIESNYQSHYIYRSEFSGYYNMYRSRIHEEFYIYDSRFKEGAHIGPHFEGTFTDFLTIGTVFEQIDSELPLLLEEISSDSIVYKTQVVFNIFGKLDQFSLDDNQFYSKGDEQYVYISGASSIGSVSIVVNLFQSQLYIAATIGTRMDFVENETLGNIILSDLILEGKNNDLNWAQFDGFKLAVATIPADMFTDPNRGYDFTDEYIDQIWVQTSNFAIKTFRGITDEEFEDEILYQRLISSYYRLYKVFKENGQIADANHTYVEMKDVQLRLLKYKYREYGGLENFIQWRLNQLLKFYTDYGTNPSQAIRISIFVVFLFSIFYFFFPSEWDTKSKGQLILDYKIFSEKNNHGYFKPFLRLSVGFFISLVNAITLSLNSFVTLGFGTIPTSGLARYVCILQGFIGWFLLSVFTASLINQVMF